jgi:integrase/recombinase XerD
MKVSDAVGMYVAMKHVMGGSFKWGTEVLRAFCRHVGDRSLDAVAEGQVSAFLGKSASSDRAWLLRYRILRAFFDYWVGRNELAKAPLPQPRRPGTARTTVAYVYSASELRRLLDASCARRRATPRGFSSLTFRTLLLFLYATGARINETVALMQQDIDLKNGTITFHRPSPATGRTVPISPHLWRSLREYARSFPTRDDRKAFFCSTAGEPVREIDLTVRFQTLRRQAGVARPAGSPQPQIRDLRRTFAVHCMRKWLRGGKDLRSMLPLLGAYLGHVDLSSTEAYLAVMPERFRVQLWRLGSACEKSASRTTPEVASSKIGKLGDC